eukprot:TRINITY_DN26841_c0_g1_i3.p1 TRINITY_DN26841_c0_g1~~TRINITY_DN26841_c0_g1_i3.p1  ORF type:complete len:108 (-),score=4.79 TRINITY_DN26841_c0_g1_i3:577-900(-)
MRTSDTGETLHINKSSTSSPWNQQAGSKFVCICTYLGLVCVGIARPIHSLPLVMQAIGINPLGLYVLLLLISVGVTDAIPMKNRATTAWKSYRSLLTSTLQEQFQPA